MQRHEDFPLSELTTLGLGGPARELAEAESEAELIELVSAADDERRPLLLLAGGSNLVIADEGWDGLVVAVRTRGIEREPSGGRTRLTVAAGESWDELVAASVAEGLAGIEALSGIPGSVGATPIQNVGAYGQEVAETIVSVRVWDRDRGAIVELAPSECRFSYRSSAFKRSDRHIVLAVGFELEPAELGMPVAYAQLAGELGIEIGSRAPLTEVREAVLALRRGKGMVVDPGDPDSRSAGSFFTNPVLTSEAFAALRRRVAAELGAEVKPPSWPEPDQRVKTSAAWLIERAGFGRGYGDGAAGVSAKHTLALINRGGASTTELIGLARELRDGVRGRFGVELEPEPRLIGVDL